MIAYITDGQVDELRGKEWQTDCYFAPFQISDGWAISEQEVIGCVTDGLEWVGKLPLVDYVPTEQQIP